MSFIIKPEEIVLGEANIFTLDIELLLNQELVKNSEYFSNSDNWKYVYISYENSIGQYNNLIFDIPNNKLTAPFDPSIKADVSSNWNILHAVIRDFDGGYLKLERGDLTVADFDIALGSVGGDIGAMLFSNSLHHSTNVVISSDQLTANFPTLDYGHALSDNTEVLSGQKFYAEFVINSVGILEVGFSFYDTVPDVVNTASRYPSNLKLMVSLYQNGDINYGNSSSSSGINKEFEGWGFVAGDTIGIAIDTAAQEVYVKKNGVWLPLYSWLGPSNPETGTDGLSYAGYGNATNGDTVYLSVWGRKNINDSSITLVSDPADIPAGYKLLGVGSVGGDVSSLIFDFEGFATASDITDTTGNISTTSVGASLVDDRNGKVLTKIGRHDHLLIPAQGILQGSEFTISMWYNGLETNDSIYSISSVPRGQYGIGPGGIFSGMAFYVYGTNKQVQFMLVDNSSYQGANSNVTSPSSIVGSTWIKFDITIGNSELKLYQDGQLISSSSYDPNSLSNILSALNNTADSEIVLLNSVVPNSNEYQNYMDDFKIISRVLTDEEILENYNSSVDDNTGELVSSPFLTNLPYPFNSAGAVYTNNDYTVESTSDTVNFRTDLKTIVPQGKYYVELNLDQKPTEFYTYNFLLGIFETNYVELDLVTNSGISVYGARVMARSNGSFDFENSINNSGIAKANSSLNNGDVIGMAIDIELGVSYFHINGSWFNGADPSNNTGGYSDIYTANISSSVGKLIVVSGKIYGGGQVTMVENPQFIPDGYEPI